MLLGVVLSFSLSLCHRIASSRCDAHIGQEVSLWDGFEPLFVHHWWRLQASSSDHLCWEVHQVQRNENRKAKYFFKRSNMKTTTDTFLCFLSTGFTSAFPPQLSLQCNTHFVHRVGLLRPGCLYLQGDGSYRTDRHVKCDSCCSWLWPWTVCFIHFVSVTLACLSFHFYHYCANKWSFRVLLVFLFFPQLRQMVRPPIFVCVLHLFLVFARWDIDNQLCWDSVNT